MRLIDADEFRKYIINGWEDTKDLFQDDQARKFAETVTSNFLKDIDEQPTAYDLDGVLERLRYSAVEAEVFGIGVDYVPLGKAIEIVKGGVK